MGMEIIVKRSTLAKKAQACVCQMLNVNTQDLVTINVCAGKDTLEMGLFVQLLILVSIATGTVPILRTPGVTTKDRDCPTAPVSMVSTTTQWEKAALLLIFVLPLFAMT